MKISLSIRHCTFLYLLDIDFFTVSNLIRSITGSRALMAVSSKHSLVLITTRGAHLDILQCFAATNGS